MRVQNGDHLVLSLLFNAGLDEYFGLLGAQGRIRDAITFCLFASVSPKIIIRRHSVNALARALICKASYILDAFSGDGVDRVIFKFTSTRLWIQSFDST
jgi:hypothetical protein